MTMLPFSPILEKNMFQLFKPKASTFCTFFMYLYFKKKKKLKYVDITYMD